MSLIKRLVLPVAALLLSATFAVAELITCQGEDGCQVRLWDPGAGAWGDPEDVPPGTVIDTSWGMGWGEGWVRLQ